MKIDHFAKSQRRVTARAEAAVLETAPAAPVGGPWDKVGAPDLSGTEERATLVLPFPNILPRKKDSRLETFAKEQINH